MEINKNNIVWVMVALFTIFILGVGIGYNTKKSPQIVATKSIVDTFYSSYPIEVEKVVTKPINKVSHDTTIIVKKGNTIHSIDTFIQVVNYDFVSIDTLHYDSLSVAILDSGDCNGIQHRSSTFFGKLSQREIVKTVTNNIILPQPFLQLNFGVMTTFDTKFNKVLDIAPMVALEYHKKYQASYNYQINQKHHNISISTKIK